VTQWQDEQYRQVFEETCGHLESALREDRLTRDELERLLEAAYVDQGNDWLGRGSFYDIVQAATIAAYEHVLAELDGRAPPAGE
jgi:hypothetical protein